MNTLYGADGQYNFGRLKFVAVSEKKKLMKEVTLLVKESIG